VTRLALGRGEDAVGKAWLDVVNLNDAHKWISASGESTEIEIHPESETPDQSWHPGIGTDTHQPITRWRLELDGSYGDASIVLVRIPHPPS